jgi:hypothetical protein
MAPGYSLRLAVLGIFLSALTLASQAQTAARQPKPGTTTSEKAKCMVAEIRGIAFSIHHPGERYMAVSDWLKKNGAACSLDKLQYINSNRPNWFGHADSPALGQIMDQYIEVATGSTPKQSTLPPEKERSSLMGSAGGVEAPAPVVQATAGQPPIVVAPVVAATGAAGGKGPGKP